MKRIRNFLLPRTNQILCAIILVAAFLRLYRIGEYMTFLGDEGRDVLTVYQILHGDLTLLGPRASAGDFFLGPIYYYMITPFLLLFNYHPVGPAIFVALIGIATVYLVYKMGSMFFDVKAGLIAAALYAVSPVVIAYSRSSWNPNPMPFFSLLILLSVLGAVKKQSVKLFLLTGFLLGIAIQLHYLTTFLGAIVFFFVLLFYALLFKGKVVEKALKSALSLIEIFIGFLMGLSPFLLFEVVHGFPNIKTIFSFVFKSGEVSSGGSFQQIVGGTTFRLFGRLVTNFPPPEQVSIGGNPYITFMYYVTIVLAVISIVIFFLVLTQKIHKKDNDRLVDMLLVTVWGVVGVLLFGLYKKNIYDYYYGFLFPLPFLLVGNAISFLIDNKYTKIAGIIIVVALFIINFNANPFKYPPNNQYEQVKRIADFVLSKTNGEPFNFALITQGNSDHSYRYIFKLNNQDPVTLENIEIDPERKSVTKQLLIICEDKACNPLGNSLWEVAGFGRAEIVGEWDLQFVKVYRLVPFESVKPRACAPGALCVM